MSATLQEQIAFLSREIRMRELCYPRWVEAKKMSLVKAEYELQHMRAVLDSLEKLKIKETMTQGGT